MVLALPVADPAGRAVDKRLVLVQAIEDSLQ